MNNTFLSRVESVVTADAVATIQPGSAHPENWQTTLQSGKSQEELRKDAITLHEWCLSLMEQFPLYKEKYDHLSKGDGKHLELFKPILSKGLSRSKLTDLADICHTLALMAPIE
jgi:hypothetical protein